MPGARASNARQKLAKDAWLKWGRCQPRVTQPPKCPDGKTYPHLGVGAEALSAASWRPCAALRPNLKKSADKAPAGRRLDRGHGNGRHGSHRYRLYRPPEVRFGERLPLLVMLHGCGQDAKSFAQSTRMNRIAARERFLVLYPEQDRLANAQGCWNWFDTRSGRAYGEAELIMRAIDQVCLLYSADARVWRRRGFPRAPAWRRCL